MKMRSQKFVAFVLVAALIIAALVPLLNSCNDGENNDDGNKLPPPKSMGYRIITSYPHDTGSFTQGLDFYNGSLYEGTGDYGRSKLMRINLSTGKPELQISLDRQYFGEGITILNDTLYQLTWKEKTVFAYDVKDFKLLKTFTITHEGWGLTHDGTQLIASDGSSNLYFYDPADFRLIRKQEVSESGSLAFNLNELEFIDGFVYANQWNLPYILKIDPATGLVDAKADVSELWSRVKQKQPQADVPNGIAYDEASGKLYITGKRWPELYEVDLSR